MIAPVPVHCFSINFVIICTYMYNDIQQYFSIKSYGPRHDKSSLFNIRKQRRRSAALVFAS